MDRKIKDRTLEEAARWFVRLQAADCSLQERAAFRRWQDADPRHALAYEQACQAAAGIDQLVALDPRMQALLDEALIPAVAPAVAGPVRGLARVRRWSIPVALAASLALAFVSILFVGDGTRAPDGVVLQAETAPRTVELQDGSTVQMDVNTKVRVRMTAERREVTLEAGRAMFDVAHDRSRPFSVAAATSRTVALGTRFQVELDRSKVVVTLAEGSVAIDNESPTRVWQEQLHPGEQLRIDVASATRDKLVVDPAVVTSWTRGRLVFRNTRLVDAIEQVNRYSTKKVRLADPSLGDLHVAGNFIAGDSDLIVDALASALPLRVVEGGEREVILFRRYDDDSR
jgi:transmembrane sensor